MTTDPTASCGSCNCVCPCACGCPSCGCDPTDTAGSAGQDRIQGSAAHAARPLDVYVINGKRKPLATGQQVDAVKLPATVTHDGGTYHFSNADLVDKTATFTNVPLDWH